MLYMHQSVRSLRENVFCAAGPNKVGPTIYPCSPLKNPGGLGYAPAVGGLVKRYWHFLHAYWRSDEFKTHEIMSHLK